MGRNDLLWLPVVLLCLGTCAEASFLLDVERAPHPAATHQILTRSSGFT